ncbi:MAG: bifunctional precorrin-2 dehydrogenase/sirohydrochlorin ferrochelatase [Pseudomonadota bacterium]
MDVFPVFFRMQGATVGVFGGGENARRKVRLLAKTPAKILIFAEKLDPDFEAEFAPRIHHFGISAAPAHLPNCRFVIIAEPDDTLAEAAVGAARAANVPINRVDELDWCDFIVPSMLDRGKIVAAVSSGGAAPVLARNIRGALETLMPPTLTALADVAFNLRGPVFKALTSETDRRRFWEDFFAGPTAANILAGETVGDLSRLPAEFAARKEKATPAQPPVDILSPPNGTADQVSLRAFRALQVAEWAGFAPRTDTALLELIRRDADRIVMDGGTTGLIDAVLGGARCVVILPEAQQAPIKTALEEAGIAWRVLT